jgi:hypothetical protein
MSLTPPPDPAIIICFHHHADTKSKRDLRDDIPFNMTPQEMLELATDIENRLVHVYGSQPPRPRHQNAVAIMQRLVAGLRALAQSQRWRLEVAQELTDSTLRLVAALWHFSNVQSWVLTPDEAESLFELYQVLGEFEAVCVANTMLRVLVCEYFGVCLFGFLGCTVHVCMRAGGEEWLKLDGLEYARTKPDLPAG